MMATRRVALASFIFLALLASFYVLPGQPSPSASAEQRRRATKETPQFGHVEISTTPAGYPISIDGQPAGETTEYVRVLELAPGEHTIEVSFPANTLWSQRLSVRAGERKCISLVFRSNSARAASARRTPPSSTETIERGEVSESIVDCGEMAMPEDGRVLAAEKPPIVGQSPPATLNFPQTTSAPPPPTISDPEAVVISAPPPVGTSAPPTDSLEKKEEPKKNEDYEIVPIFYGTDRARTGKQEPKEFYGAGRGKLELGTCEVSIPKTHQRGQLESPSIWRLEFKEDPKLHVVLLSVKPLGTGEFNSQFKSQLDAARSRDVFVFVHGYNVKFVDAARRTAQLAYDLNFPGVPVLYSWPSQGSLSGYTTDENEIVWTEPHLKKFLADLTALGAGARIHLVAHSMGNRALTNVLRSLATESATPLFSEVVLTAPDVDAEVFERDLAPAIQKIARRVTLYASSSDAALLASKKVHGYQRAGDSLPTIIVAPGIDSIDASGIDTDMLGHSYFAQMKDVMDDMNLLLIAGKLPGERSLVEQVRGAGKFWRLRAAAALQDGQRPNMIPGAGFLNFRYGLMLAALLAACAVALWLIIRARRRAAN